MKLLLLLILIIPFMNVSSAENCKRVNLLYKKWGQFPRQMPLYNQGKNGICYAYAASQMVDYWRETHGLRFKNMKMGQSTPVYAALLARIYGEKSAFIDNSSLNTGTVYDAIKAIQKKGMCNEHIIKKSLEKFTKKKSVDVNDFLWEMERFLTLHHPRKIKSKLNKYFMAPFENLRKRMKAPNINFDKISPVMKPYLKDQNFLGFMKDVFKDCFEHENIYLNSKKIPNVIVQHMDQKAIKLIQKVKELLDVREKPQPIGIGYCENILEDKKYLGINHRYQTPRVVRGCHGHASIIVGKRERAGKCQFLVRNTYGTHCKYDWECSLNPKKEALGIWVDAQRLMLNTRKIYYLERSK